VNGETPVVGLQDLGPLNAGDTVTMTWLAVGAECDPPGTGQVPIVLAMKSAPGPFFDASVDQALDLPYALDFLSAGLGEHSVSYVLPDLLDDSFPGCYGQLDAIVGLPLAVVGPNGSFYSSGLRGGGPNLLISAWNGGYENCQTQETTTTTGSTTSTTEGPTTTSTPASTTTTEPPTTTTEPATTVPPSSTIAAAPTTEPPVLTPAKAQAAQTSRQLAQTGRSSGPWALVGLAVIVGGLVLLVVTRRRLV
jgi:LPXTG-motif cell wall-anchored protein